MKYMQSWQDFMREPENKALKESKGIHACKQKYIQEQNKMQWHDPVIIQENGEAGISLADTTTATAGGGSNGFIKGFSKSTTTLTWVTGLHRGFTASANFGITVPVLTGFGGGSDFSQGHVDSRKKILLAFVTGSTLKDLAGLSTTGIDCVVTASCFGLATEPPTGLGASGSWADVMENAIASQAAGSLVGGFTNTSGFTPANVLTATTSSANLTVTHVTAGSVNASSTGLNSATGSITFNNGNDTFASDPGGQIFDGQVAPYTSMPRTFD